MNTSSTFFGAVGAVLLAGMLNLQAGLLSLSWDSGFAYGGLIPDDNPLGWSDTRAVHTSYSSIEEVAVTLNISSEFNGDLYAYLLHDNKLAVLLNRVGRTEDTPNGYDDAGFILTLSDASEVLTDIHCYGGNGGFALTGLFQSDGRDVAPETVLDSDLRTARLSSFAGLNPNGNWTLFCADRAGGAESTIVSWGLQIQAVPEPVNTALIILAAIAGPIGLATRLRKRRGSLKT